MPEASRLRRTQGLDVRLLAALEPFEVLDRLEVFIDFSGLADDELVVTGFTATPVPKYVNTLAPGARRFPHARPEAMWHPLFWLPQQLVTPRPVAGTGRNLKFERPDVWATRILIEMTAANLYSESDGAWSDVLIEHGIDVDDPDDLARIQRWLDSAPDPVLDSIDLSDRIISDQEWSATHSQQVAADLNRSAWTWTGLMLSMDVDRVVERATRPPGTSDMDLLENARLIADMAEHCFAFRPRWSPIDLGYGGRYDLIHRVLPAMKARFERIYEQQHHQILTSRAEQEREARNVEWLIARRAARHWPGVSSARA